MRSRGEWTCAALGLVVVLFWVDTASSRPQFVNYVPTPFGCETCHDVPDNRGIRNAFGIDFADQHAVWASDDDAVCPLDSDRDGLTNGEELGDPDCTWRRGDPRPDFPATHPSDPRDPDRCGDGVIQVGEDCDGDALGDERCEDRGFLEGILGCTENCEYDDSLCVEFPEEDVGMPDADPMDAGMEDVPLPDAAEPDAGDADADATPLEDTTEADATSDDGGTSPSEANPSDTGGCTTVANAPIRSIPFLVLLLLLTLVGRSFGSHARWGHMEPYCVRDLPPR